MNNIKTELYKFPKLSEYHEVRHFVSTRFGGISEGAFAGLNLGFGTDDDQNSVLENRYILAESLGIPLDWFVFPRQTHSANMVKVDYSHRGLGSIDRDNAIPDTDAIITGEKNICIVVQVADCVPVLLLDAEKGAIAAIHAGWRGTVKEIVSKTISAMNQEFGTDAKDIVAAIGPSIGTCHYEVGEEVFQAFMEINSNYESCFTTKNRKLNLDLWKANQLQLVQSGVQPQNIEISGICTQCNSDKFFSSRQGKGSTGRFVAGIMLI